MWPSSCVTPAGTSNELDVQNEWEENTHTVYYSGFLPGIILLFTQASILVWFDGTNIDIISTVLLTMYYSVYDFKEKSERLCMVINIIIVKYNGGFLPDVILLTHQGYYHHWGTRLNTM